MVVKFVVFVILIKACYSFHINYKILRNKNPKHRYIRKIISARYFYKHPKTQSRESKNKILSFFSNYFSDEAHKYTLNEEEKNYLKMLGRTENDDYKELVKYHEDFIKTCNDIKSKLKYKDIFFFITQKIIQKNLHDFKRKQKFPIFGNDDYTSELSVDYIKSSNIEENIKEQILQKLRTESGACRFFPLRIFKWKSLLEIINITTLMLPVASIGLFLSKMGLFSVAVNMLLTAHFLTFKKDQKKKMKVSTLFLTLLPILIHSSLGVACNHLFLKHYRYQIPTFIKAENILSFFINVQLYIASIVYFVNNDNEEEAEEGGGEGELKNDYMDFNDIPLDQNI
ncbi:conserved Plasmodium protein, unknown function [Plasmodium ovale]|uniref:Uncharacterized protein n=2 Tax=Plasmodium ovale TaxID=36330 RepID=A0A1C3L5B3_PLAOA|nr:conserved Plasmodium protein, unknown function [Plasmodium ovale]